VSAQIFFHANGEGRSIDCDAERRESRVVVKTSYSQRTHAYGVNQDFSAAVAYDTQEWRCSRRV
nr:hypothetical protein [Tanacetum cinerariifolium]